MSKSFFNCGLKLLVCFVAFAELIAKAAVPADHAERMARGLENFQKEVRGILTENCLKCHGDEKIKGDLDLSTREGLLKGSSDGPVIVPFDARASRLVSQIRHEKEPHMPDKGAKLSDEFILKITEWINNGAPYDKPLLAGKKSSDRSIVTDQDKKWWAFQPLAKNEPPLENRKSKIKNPIDRFILAKAAGKKLSLSRPADQRTLIRRAYFDLLGLPPTPEEVEKFVRDKSTDAWPQLIDRLLASPNYGERWARHWLDVARFAESSGFEHDYDREGAFYYRDFVIKALNADMPFDQFARWQIAGDEFAPENPLALTATGFLGAGVFPTQITANEVERTRYDALDDMLSTTSAAFLGLTVGCARCHDHKYDPIPTRDYYRMLSTFTTTTRSVIDLDVEPEKTRVLEKKWEADHAPLVATVARYEKSLKPKFKEWLASDVPAAQLTGWTILELTNIASQAGATFKKLGDGSYLVEGTNGDDDNYTLVGSTSLRQITGLRLDALAHSSMQKGGPGRADNGNIGLSKIRIFATPSSGGVAQEIKLAKAKADFEQNKKNLSIAGTLDDDPKTGWAVDPQLGKDHSAIFFFAQPLDFTNGVTLKVKLEFHLNTKHNIGRPRLSVTTEPKPSLQGDVLPARVSEVLAHKSEPDFATKISAADRAIIFDWWKRTDTGWHERTAKVDEHATKKPDGKTKVLVCAEGNKPLRMNTQGVDFFTNTFFLKRGSTDLKDGVAPQNFLQVLMRAPDAEKDWQWQPPVGAKFSGRRRSLANWLTDVDRGAGRLVARVIVNRLWQHHFGQGIVTSPNDFGKAGTLPSHPELLDWLAGELIRNGWKLKPIHKLIMTSATYLQSSAPDHAKEIVDVENKYFCRRLPRRLEGEAIRDCILSVSGALDETMFGAGTKDEKSRRRSIYFTIKRSQLIGSMVAFDQPEPLASQGARPTTTVTPQALLLMNGPQVREWAESFAKKILAEKNDARDFSPLVTSAYQRALARQPARSELRDAEKFLKTQMQSYSSEKKDNARWLALTDFCQVLFGLNEFVYEN